MAPALRWRIAVMVSAAIAISYLDPQTLPVAIKAIQHYLFWLPKYLYDARGFDIRAVGTFAWIPFAAAGVGCLCGGWFSSWLLRRQCSLNLARKLPLGGSAAVMPFILFVPHVPPAAAIALFSNSL